MNSTVSFGSRTQGTIALSPDEAELYAVGQGTSEALYIRNLITEAKLAKSVNINIHTDSTVGKSMATRIGASKKTMHVELRFRYVQELVGKRLIKLRKVRTDCNCANVTATAPGTNSGSAWRTEQHSAVTDKGLPRFPLEKYDQLTEQLTEG